MAQKGRTMENLLNGLRFNGLRFCNPSESAAALWEQEEEDDMTTTSCTPTKSPISSGTPRHQSDFDFISRLVTPDSHQEMVQCETKKTDKKTFRNMFVFAALMTSLITFQSIQTQKMVADKIKDFAMVDSRDLVFLNTANSSSAIQLASPTVYKKIALVDEKMTFLHLQSDSFGSYLSSCIVNMEFKTIAAQGGKPASSITCSRQ